MNITKKVNGETMTVSIKGRLDTSTAPEFETFMNENLAEVGNLILDCEGLEYISSAGLRVLLFAQKKMKDSLKLVNVRELIMEVFDITGFSDILTIE
jgi:anti-sigma B factor antagonist